MLVVALASCQAGSCTAPGVEPDAGEASEPDATSRQVPTADVDEPIAAAKEFYASRPYYQQPLGHTEVPEGLPNLRAETCGACHQAIYREWKVSTHHRAWSDPQFQAELKKSRGGHGGGDGGGERDDVGWMCVNCHTPLINQQERLVVELADDNIGKPTYVDNPDFSPKLKEEGITCAGCHVRDGTVYGPWGDTDAPHPTAKDPDLRSEQNCVRCHQAEAQWPSRNLACFFTTGQEWESSKYSEQDRHCQSCHMPKVERRLVAGSETPKRTTRRHWFGGSLVPKRPEYRDEIEPLHEVYGNGAKIEVLPGAAPPEAKAEPSGDAGADDRRPGLLEPGDCPSEADRCEYVRIRVTNAYAGHRLPTGDPERHIDIRGEVGGEDGEPVAAVEQRIGSKYEWWPEIVLQYDNRLDPGEHLDVRLAVPASELPAKLSVVADKYRMYPEAYEHHDLEGKYVRGREFHRSTWRLAGEGEAKLQKIADDWGERTHLVPEEKRDEQGDDSGEQAEP